MQGEYVEVDDVSIISVTVGRDQPLSGGLSFTRPLSHYIMHKHIVEDRMTDRLKSIGLYWFTNRSASMQLRA